MSDKPEIAIIRNIADKLENTPEDIKGYIVAVKNKSGSTIVVCSDDVIVGRGSLIDATIWTNALPKEQK